MSSEIPNTVPLMILNGFCLMFKRDLVSAIGNFDQEHFPEGYGEEVDFSIRAAKAGFEGRVVPAVYVYHKKTASFKNERKEQLKKASRATLIERYGESYLRNFDTSTQSQSDLAVMRSKVKLLYDSIRAKYADMSLPGSILFALHDVGFSGGGVISILTEALQMRLYGVNVSVSIPINAAKGAPLDVVRAILPGISEQILDELIVLHPIENMAPAPTSPEFIALASTFDVVVATYCKTMIGVEAVAKQNPRILVGYYAQDYEPWFWYSPYEPDKNPKGRSYVVAVKSYTANNKKAFILAKTLWTAHMIKKTHKVGVNIVQGSMDHDIYYPDRTMLAFKLKKRFPAVTGGDEIMHVTGKSNEHGDIFRIVAMIRPSTPRRNPLHTLDLILRIVYYFPPSLVQVTLCGCSQQQVVSVFDALVLTHGNASHRSMEVMNSSSITFANVVEDRDDMANMFRSSHLFVDLSWWQAFGRTGLEAMATGCVAIMPVEGASTEICEGGKYCLVHDGNDVNGYFDKVVDVLKNNTKRYNLIRNGIEQTWLYTVHGAAASMATKLKIGLRHHLKGLH